MEHCAKSAAGAIRIILTPEDSEALLAAGDFFAVIQRGQYPEHSGMQMILHVLPCDYATASASVEVAQGIRKAGKRFDPTTKA